MITMKRVSHLFPMWRNCSFSRGYRSAVREVQPSRISVDVLGGEKIIEDPKHTLTEVEESEEEFKYVEKLLASPTVPEPPAHESYPTPSGWVPQSVGPNDLPYFVKRTRFHNFPVYLETHAGGNRKMTVIRKVQGDIWALESELRTHLEEKLGRRMYTQVDEVCRKLRVRGVFVMDVGEYLLDKGL